MSVIRQRTKNLIYAGLVGALATAIVSTVLGIFTYSQWSKEKAIIRADYEQKLLEAEQIKQEQSKQRKKVLVAKKNIKAGQKLTTEQFTQVELPSDQIPENIIVSPKQLDGKITKIDISKNGTVLPSMLFEEDITPDDLRNSEYTEIILPTKLTKDDFVDVRINFPTGQDYIVLGKKKVEDLLNGTVWFEVNEQEILTMSSAVVDAYLHEAKIYALSYVDPYFQDKPIVNYPVNEKVLELINSDPNIIRLAKSKLNKNDRILLERDLDSMSAEQKQKISNARSSSITQKQNAQNPSENKQIDEGTTETSITPIEPLPLNEPLPSTENSTPPQNDNVSSGESSLTSTKELEIYKESVGNPVQP